MGGVTGPCITVEQCNQLRVIKEKMRKRGEQKFINAKFGCSILNCKWYGSF
jgi:hypothetical protein